MLVSCAYLGFLGDFFLRIGERERERKTLVCVFGWGFFFV